MAQLDSDPFTYSNGNLETVSSAKWAKFSGMGGSSQVVSNRIQGSGESLSQVTSWVGSTTLQYSELEWVSGQFGGPTIFGDGVSSCYLLDMNANGNLGLYKVIAGSYTALSTVGAYAITAGHIYRIYMSTAGTLKGSDNGVDFLTKTSETSLTSGTPGFRANQLYFDNWAAGDFAISGKAALYNDQMRRQ